MSKQKRNYHPARPRASTSSRVHTGSEGERQENIINLNFSNLLHNYEKVKQVSFTPKFSLTHLHSEGSRKPKAQEVLVKQSERKFPFQQYFFTQRNCVGQENKRQSNYSLYLQRSMSKRSRKTTFRMEKIEKQTSQLSKSQLLVPCKVSAIKIQTRNFEMNPSLKEFRESVKFQRRKQSAKLKMASQLVLNKKLGDEIEPWGMKNYESIVL